MPPKLRPLEETSISCELVHSPEYIPDHNRNGKSQKDKHKAQDIPSKCHHSSVCDSKRGGERLGSEEKVIFVFKLLESIFPVHPHRFHRKNI